MPSPSELRQNARSRLTTELVEALSAEADDESPTLTHYLLARLIIAVESLEDTLKPRGSALG